MYFTCHKKALNYAKYMIALTGIRHVISESFIWINDTQKKFVWMVKIYSDNGVITRLNRSTKQKITVKRKHLGNFKKSNQL
jgi:hypothetical protein